MFEAILLAIISFILLVGVGYIVYLIIRPSLERSILKEKSITICPKCGSTKHRTVAVGNAGANLIMGAAPHIYKCQACGFQGVFPIIDTEEISNFQKEVTKKPKSKKKTVTKKK